MPKDAPFEQRSGRCEACSDGHEESHVSELPAQPGHGAGAFVVVIVSNDKAASTGACARIRGASDD